MRREKKREERREERGPGDRKGTVIDPLGGGDSLVIYTFP